MNTQKNTKAKYISLLLTLILILASFASCGAPQESESTQVESNSTQVESESGAQQEETTSEGTFPVTITDHLDREITIEQKPERLVSGYYVSTSMLISLGLKDSVVGIEAKADTRPIYSLAASEFLQLPNVGTAKEFNLEGCIELMPDLVILPVSLREQTVGLEEVGINVLYVNPENTALFEEAYMNIGKATGTQDRASEIISYSHESLSELNEKIMGIEQETLYLGGNSDFLSTAGAKMYQNTMIENAGCINVAAEIEDTYWANVDYEQILRYNPEFIILAAAADYSVQDVLNDTSISSVSAVLTNDVYAMPGNIEAWDSPLPASFLGSLFIASSIYPDAYTAEDFSAKVTEFYETYYAFTPPAAQ